MQRIKYELNQNKKYILFGMLVSILTMLPHYFMSSTFKHSILLTITLLLLFLIPKFSKIIFSIFIIFLNISSIIIGHIAMHWGYSVGDMESRIKVADLSPTYEIIEYLSNYIDYKDFLLIIYSLFTLYLLYKFLIHFTHSFKTLKLISISLVTIIMIGISFYKNPIKMIEPFNLPYTYMKMATGDHDILYMERNKYLKSINYKIKKNNYLIYDKIIIIMGESVNKHHMKLYGYDKNTTPFLSLLEDAKNLYIFNMIAAGNHTSLAVPMALTKANVHNYYDLYVHSPSIVSNFKINGYKTYWISNQGQLGKGDTPVSSMANEADIRIFENFDYHLAHPDEIILKYLDIAKNESSKEMFLIHLLGSHASYDKRYTKKALLHENAENIIEQYDNTIYYTDYILREIFNKFKDKKLLFIYVSDHGDVVNEKKYGHGFLPPFRDEYDIPFVVYSNIKNPKLDELHKKNKDTYFNAENLNYIIEYISGISDENNISFSHQVLAVDPKHIIDYDKLEYYKN